MIKKCEISYGSAKKELIIPEANLAGFLKPVHTQERHTPEESIEFALDNPSDGNRLEDRVSNKKVCVTIEDYTRSEPHNVIAASISKRLLKASMVQYIIVTGTHNPRDARNLNIKKAIEEVASDIGLRFDVAINDSRDSEGFDCAGTTTRGTVVMANKKALDADMFIASADMKPHYFAGYSAANKHFLPGICAFDTVRVNHCGLIKDEKSNYGRHPWHYDPKRQDNPLAADMIEAMQIISKDRQIFTLGMISDGDILWSMSGPIEPVTREGIRRADDIFSSKVNPVKHLIVSPGGTPEDDYLYSGQRALELTSEAVTTGGEVLWLSECALGIHTGVNQSEIDDFYNSMKLDLASLITELDKPEVKFHTYKAYRFKRLLGKIKVYGYSSLEDYVMESVGIKPVKNPQDVIDKWLADDPEDRIMVIDKANKLAVYGI